MSLYASQPEPTSLSPASGKVLLEDLPLAPGDPEHIKRIKANGLECLGRLHGDLTWDDWVGAGEAMMIITGEALAAVGAFKWGNKHLIKEFSARWNEYASGAGNNHKPLSKQERWALREVMTNPAIGAWRSTLTSPEKRRLNHPNAVINRWKAHQKAKAIPAEDRKPSPMAKRKILRCRKSCIA